MTTTIVFLTSFRASASSTIRALRMASAVFVALFNIPQSHMFDFSMCELLYDPEFLIFLLKKTKSVVPAPHVPALK